MSQLEYTSDPSWLITVHSCGYLVSIFTEVIVVTADAVTYFWATASVATLTILLTNSWLITVHLYVCFVSILIEVIVVTADAVTHFWVAASAATMVMFLIEPTRVYY